MGNAQMAAHCSHSPGQANGWDDTDPDNYAELHIGNTATEAGAAAIAN